MASMTGEKTINQYSINNSSLQHVATLQSCHALALPAWHPLTVPLCSLRVPQTNIDCYEPSLSSINRPRLSNINTALPPSISSDISSSADSANSNDLVVEVGPANLSADSWLFGASKPLNKSFRLNTFEARLNATCCSSTRRKGATISTSYRNESIIPEISYLNCSGSLAYPPSLKTLVRYLVRWKVTLLNLQSQNAPCRCIGLVYS